MALGFSSLGGSGGLTATSSATSATGDQSFASDFIVNQGESSGGASRSMIWAAAGVAAVLLLALVLGGR